MKCPKCGKELIIRDEKVAVDENGTAVYNQFAVCMDCKKKWNLDKQRAKKTASQARPAEASKAPAAQKAPAKSAGTDAAENSAAKPVKKKAPVPVDSEGKPMKKKVPVPEEREARPVKKKTPAPVETDARPVKKKAPAPAETEARPAKKKAPVPADSEGKPVKKKAPAETGARPVKKKPLSDTDVKPAKKKAPVSQQTYSNIPPKEIREQREEDMRRGYDEMLTSGEEDEPKRSKIPVIIMTVLIILALAAAGTIFYCKATGKAIPFISLSRTESSVSGEMYAENEISCELPAGETETDLTEASV